MGAGGFTLSAKGDYGNKITYVDIDPAILQTVKEHYLPEIYGEFVAADARVFVQQDQEKYVAVVVDVYSHQLTIPAHLLTVEFFAAVNHTLLSGGVAVFNIVADPFLNDPYSKAIDAGLRVVFKSCANIPLTYADKAVNIIYVCQQNDQLDLVSVIKQAKGQYYTDDLNRATWDQQFLKME